MRKRSALLSSSPCSWQRRAIHTWGVPTCSFQGAAAPHTPHFPLRWPKSWYLFVQLQKQGVLQAGKAAGQSWDVLWPEELLRLSRGSAGLVLTHETSKFFNCCDFLK